MINYRAPEAGQEKEKNITKNINFMGTWKSRTIGPGISSSAIRIKELTN